MSAYFHASFSFSVRFVLSLSPSLPLSLRFFISVAIYFEVFSLTSQVCGVASAPGHVGQLQRATFFFCEEGEKPEGMRERGRGDPDAEKAEDGVTPPPSPHACG